MPVYILRGDIWGCQLFQALTNTGLFIFVLLIFKNSLYIKEMNFFVSPWCYQFFSQWGIWSLLLHLEFLKLILKIAFLFFSLIKEKFT